MSEERLTRREAKFLALDIAWMAVDAWVHQWPDRFGRVDRPTAELISRELNAVAQSLFNRRERFATDRARAISEYKTDAERER